MKKKQGGHQDMKLTNWIKEKFNKDTQLVKQAIKASGKNRYVIFMDSESELIVHAYNGKCVPVRTYDKDKNLIPLVKRILSNGQRPNAMMAFIRQIDGAIYNLTMNDKKLLKKLAKINKESKKQGVEFGVGKPDSVKDQIMAKVAKANK